MCISYTNRLKSAPKAPKFLGDFGLLIRKPPLVMAAFGTRGGFLIKVTTDPVLQGLDTLRSRPAFSLEDHCPPRIGYTVLSPSVQS